MAEGSRSRMNCDQANNTGSGSDGDSGSELFCDCDACLLGFDDTQPDGNAKPQLMKSKSVSAELFLVRPSSSFIRESPIMGLAMCNSALNDSNYQIIYAPSSLIICDKNGVDNTPEKKPRFV